MQCPSETITNLILFPALLLNHNVICVPPAVIWMVCGFRDGPQTPLFAYHYFSFSLKTSGTLAIQDIMYSDLQNWFCHASSLCFDLLYMMRSSWSAKLSPPLPPFTARRCCYAMRSSNCLRILSIALMIKVLKISRVRVSFWWFSSMRLWRGVRALI